MKGVSPNKRSKKNKVSEEIVNLLKKNPNGLLLMDITKMVPTEAYAPKDMILMHLKQMRKDGIVRLEPEPYRNGWGSLGIRNRYFCI
jgi:ABC-type enterochelin transport system substrate-binding protein